MRKYFLASAASLCMAVGSLTATAGGQTAAVPEPLQRTGGTIAPGGVVVYETSLQANDLLTVWAANWGEAGAPELRVRLQRWGFSTVLAGAAAMVDVGSITVAAGDAVRLDQVATTTAPHLVVIDAPGAAVDVPFTVEPATTPGSGLATEHQGQSPGAVHHVVATPPHGRDVRYLSEPAAGLHRWRVDFAAGDVLAVEVDHLGFDRPNVPLVACLISPAGAEVATATVTGAGGVLRYTVPHQGHYMIDMGCRPGAPSSGFRPHFTPRPGRVPAATSFVGAPRLVPKAGTQNGGALDRFWRIDLEAGQLLDMWYLANDPETTQGTLCVEGPVPTGGLAPVAAMTVGRGVSDHLVVTVPWTGRYVINGACAPGNGLFEIFVN